MFMQHFNSISTLKDLVHEEIVLIEFENKIHRG